MELFIGLDVLSQESVPLSESFGDQVIGIDVGVLKNIMKCTYRLLMV